MDYFEDIKSMGELHIRAKTERMRRDIDAMQKKDINKLKFSIEHCCRVLSHWEQQLEDYNSKHQASYPNLQIPSKKHIYAIHTPDNTAGVNRQSTNKAQSMIIYIEDNIEKITEELNTLRNLRDSEDAGMQGGIILTDESLRAIEKLLAYWESLRDKI